ncbi:vacuolar protein sorting-associated protein 8 homolog, partial [Sinocyclocheilus rhinocerous]|uniref:vacuolar protein sorting-associated protein 8 homolog n=1 Tax=Sinocyclocheilus rhinocerous TaxID=307959 RepID=UPI0007BA0DE2
CGHLYHCQCLQRKEVGVLSERQYSWSCYKCTSNQGTRPADRPSAESSRSCSTSLAQTTISVILNSCFMCSCGHLYHCQCLQRKEVGVLSERQYSWSCYKCTSNQGTRPADRPSAESSRSCSTSLAQTKVMSAHHGIVAEAHGRKMLTEATLDAQQTQAWDHFRTLYRGPSRLAVLTELTHSHGSERAGLSNPVHPGTGSIYHSENVQLKLSPPPLVEE